MRVDLLEHLGEVRQTLLDVHSVEYGLQLHLAVLQVQPGLDALAHHLEPVLPAVDLLLVVVLLGRGHQGGGRAQVRVADLDDLVEVLDQHHVHVARLHRVELQVVPLLDHLLQVVHQVVLFRGAVAHVLDQDHVRVQLQVEHFLEVEVAVGHGVDLEADFHAQDVPVPLVHAFVRQEHGQRDLLGELRDVVAQFGDLVRQLLGLGFAFEYLFGLREHLHLFVDLGLHLVAIEFAPVAQQPLFFVSFPVEHTGPEIPVYLELFVCFLNFEISHWHRKQLFLFIQIDHPGVE